MFHLKTIWLFYQLNFYDFHVKNEKTSSVAGVCSDPNFDFGSNFFDLDKTF